MLRTIIGLCTASALLAALPTPSAAKDFDPSLPYEGQVEVVRGEFVKGAIVMGPEIAAHETTQYGSDRRWVKASLDVARGSSWMLVLQTTYSHAWRFYRSVSFPGGDAVAAANTKRQVLSCRRSSCDYIEAAFFPLSAERTAAALQSGLRVRFNTESGIGAFVVDIPAAYFQAISKVAAGGATTQTLAAPPVPNERPTIPGVVANPEAPAKPSAAPIGQDSYQAEQMARRLQCANSGSATLIGKGPGYETFSVPCVGGETLVIRCEMGNCRVLK